MGAALRVFFFPDIDLAPDGFLFRPSIDSIPILYGSTKESVPTVGFEAVRRSTGGLGLEDVGVSFAIDVSEAMGVALSARRSGDFLGREGVSLTKLELETGADLVRWIPGTFLKIAVCRSLSGLDSMESDGKGISFFLVRRTSRT